MRVVLSALLALLAGAQALAITIPAGTYKLKWKSATDRSGSGRTMCFVGVQTLKEAEGRTFVGAASADARWAESERFLAVVDESKGTGTGFDVVYLLVDAPKTGEIDLKNAVVAKLSGRDGSRITTDPNNPLTVDLVMGAPGAQITKPMGLLVTLERNANEKGKLVPNSISISALGGWYVRINTDGGPVRVEPYDSNSNGIYNDKPTEFGGGDTVEIRSRKEWPGHTLLDLDTMTLGTAGAMDGKLYTVQVSATGDEIKFGPYTGGVGKVTIKATDTHGNALMCNSLSLDGLAGRFSLDRKELPSAVVPVGEYDITASVYYNAKPKKDGSPDNENYVFVSSKKKLRVEQDKTSVVSLGGAVDLRFTVDCDTPVDSDLVILSRSKEQSLSIDFTMGGDRICGGGYEKGAWKPVMTIRDHSGKIVHPTGCYITGCGVSVDKDWALGDYSIEIKLDLGSYQKPLLVKKLILVTE